MFKKTIMSKKTIVNPAFLPSTHGVLTRLCLSTCIFMLQALVAGNTFAATLDSRLPGGRANYVVSMASLSQGSYSNWMRLGTYQFNTNGTVTARMWVWSQARPVARSSTGISPAENCSTYSSTSMTQVRRCKVPTPGGFTGVPNDVRTGTFKLSGNNPQKVTISWNTSNAWTEIYDVATNPDSSQPMALLKLTYNTAIAKDAAGNFKGGAFAYGSNRPLTERRHMTSVQAYKKRTEFGLHYNQLDVTGNNVGSWTNQFFSPGIYRTCNATTNCLTRVAVVQDNDEKGICGMPSCPNGKDRRLQNYLVRVGADRRDLIWHWCTCLATARGEFCYTANSHLKPLLQILDDNGNFAGYVGVEVSFSMDSKNPRASDMLGLIRIAEFR